MLCPVSGSFVATSHDAHTSENKNVKEWSEVALAPVSVVTGEAESSEARNDGRAMREDVGVVEASAGEATDEAMGRAWDGRRPPLVAVVVIVMAAVKDAVFVGEGRAELACGPGRVREEVTGWGKGVGAEGEG